MKRPVLREKRDITDKHLRRCAGRLGFVGRHLPLSIAEMLAHDQRPGESTALLLAGERRRDAVDRLRQWAFGPDEK